MNEIESTAKQDDIVSTISESDNFSDAKLKILTEMDDMLMNGALPSRSNMVITIDENNIASISF